jgi:hypothetical protein
MQATSELSESDEPPPERRGHTLTIPAATRTGAPFAVERQTGYRYKY